MRPLPGTVATPRPLTGSSLTLSLGILLCPSSHKPVTNENSTEKVFPALACLCVWWVEATLLSLGCVVPVYLGSSYPGIIGTHLIPSTSAFFSLFPLSFFLFFGWPTIFRLVALFDATKRIYYLFIHTSAIQLWAPGTTGHAHTYVT